jgi:putative SOS response-associated peptidase YedK
MRAAETPCVFFCRFETARESALDAPMCERFALHSNMAAIRKRFRLRGIGAHEWTPRWNIAAGDKVPVICRGRGGRREIALLSFGLELDYHLLDRTKGPATALPARSLRRAALLQSLFASQRCIVPADAFYVTPERARPWAFAEDDTALMGIAAVWVPDPYDDAKGSFAIVTTGPNESVALLSEAMPAILFPEHEREWLSSRTDPYDAYHLIKPYPAELMRAWPVAAREGDGPDLLARVA